MGQSRWVALIVCAYGIACSGAGDGGSAEATSSSAALALEGHRDGDRDDARRKKVRREGCVDDETGGGADAGAACGWTPDDNGLSGASIVDLVYDTRSPGVVYAAGGSAVFQSTDSGATWHVQGTLSGSISQLALSGASPGALLAASTSGVVASSDAGKTWSSLSLQGLTLSSISVSAAHPLRVYVGTQRSGALRSDDGGRTWSAVGFGYPYGDTLGLSVDPGNPDTVVSSVVQLDATGAPIGGAVLRSTDGGATWTATLPGAGLGWGIARCAADPSVLYAATGNGVSRSADGGATWTTKAVGIYGATSVAISPGGCDDLYALVYADGPKHSTDGGKTFGPALNQGLDIVPVGSSGTLAVDPLRPSGVLFGSHGGIWTSSNGGSAWSLARGLLGLNVSSLAVSPLDPSRLWLSTWGSGIWERAASSQPWQRVPVTHLPLDYTFVVAGDPYVAKRVLVGGWSTLYQANDGATFAPSALTNNSFGFAFDPHDANVLYTATQVGGVFKSLDGGATWTASNGALAPWQTPAGNFIDVRGIVVDAANPQTLFIGTNGRGVYKSTDGGASWANVLAPTKAIGCVVLAPAAQASSPPASMRAWPEREFSARRTAAPPGPTRARGYRRSEPPRWSATRRRATSTLRRRARSTSSAEPVRGRRWARAACTERGRSRSRAMPGTDTWSWHRVARSGRALSRRLGATAARGRGRRVPERSFPRRLLAAGACGGSWPGGRPLLASALLARASCGDGASSVNTPATMSVKKALLKRGMQLMSDPRFMRLLQDERVMKAVMAAMSVPGKAQSFAREQAESIAKAMALATEDEVKDLRRTVRKLEEDLARLKTDAGSGGPPKRNGAE